MNKKKLKFIKLYIISLLCITSYFLLENSSIITELIEKSDKLRYKGFVTFILIGLLKYGLLVIGIGIIIILSILFLREKSN